MSDDAKKAETGEDNLLGLTPFDIGPSWARGGDEEKSRTQGKKEGRGGDHEERGRERKREGRQGGRRDERRDDRRHGRREGGRDERGERRGGKGRRFDKREGGDRGQRRHEMGGRGRRDDDRGFRGREETPPPEGFTAAVVPVEEGLDGLAKEILAGGRTYSVFDLAKLVLGARERFNVTFNSPDEAKMFRCKKDDSLWLTKDEAIGHFMRAGWRNDYYEEVVSQADPPKGNFQTVARCGISGEWLGPPNYHGYQPAIAQLHRERFAHMSLDAYKRKIRMERGEEAVAAWLEKMSKRVAYRPTGGVPPAATSTTVKESPVEEPAAEEAEKVESGSAVEADNAEDAAGDVSVGPGPEATDASEEGEQPVEGETSEVEAGDEAGQEGPADENAGSSAKPSEPLLEEMRLVQRHFLENHFDEVFQVTNRAWVNGNIPGNHLSPGLLTLLRQTVAEERRYPGKLTPKLCRQLSGRHVAVFKWRRKLKAGPSRPHPVPGDIPIADRPTTLLDWVHENSGKKLDRLWKDLLPKEIGDEEKRGWYRDLHWLLNQGYVLLMADSTIHLAKPRGDGARGAQPATTKSGGKPGKSTPATTKQTEQRAPSESPQDRSPASRPAAPSTRTKGGAPGLYALTGCTLAGNPKWPDSLSGRGLWPLRARLDVDSDEEDEENEEADEERLF